MANDPNTHPPTRGGWGTKSDFRTLKNADIENPTLFRHNTMDDGEDHAAHDNSKKRSHTVVDEPQLARPRTDETEHRSTAEPIKGSQSVSLTFVLLMVVGVIHKNIINLGKSKVPSYSFFSNR